MATTTSNPIRFLDSNRPVTNDRELLLTMFSGQVLTAFEDEIAVADKVMRISIPSGESTQYIATGFMESRYHEPGIELMGQDFRNSQRKVQLDDKFLVADFAVTDIDELLAHFSLRGEYAAKAGYALARTFDKHCLATIARASLINLQVASGAYTPANAAAWDINEGRDPKIGTYGGAIITYDALAGGITSSVAFFGALEKAAEVLDLKNVPAEGRYCIVPTSVWYGLLYARNASHEYVNFNRDFMGPALANKTDGRIMSFSHAGIMVYPNNRFEQTDATGYPERYNFPFSNCYGIVWQSEAIASVLRQGIVAESTRDTRRLEDFTVLKMLGGHDVLRPECAVTLWDDGITLTENSATFQDALDSAETRFNI